MHESIGELQRIEDAKEDYSEQLENILLDIARHQFQDIRWTVKDNWLRFREASECPIRTELLNEDSGKVAQFLYAPIQVVETVAVVLYHRSGETQYGYGLIDLDHEVLLLETTPRKIIEWMVPDDYPLKKQEQAVINVAQIVVELRKLLRHLDPIQ